MNKDSNQYYESYNWDNAHLRSKLTSKIEIIFKSIPSDTRNIVDVGCGDGTISNKLAENFDVHATDRSVNALKYLTTNKFCSSANSLPLKDASFDLVFSSEMIEHLPEEVFQNAIHEFKRISRKYIYLTFPNNENVEKNFVKCPNCSTVFNKIYHLRKLNEHIITNLFPEYDIIFKTVYGAKIKRYNEVLAKIKHKTVSSNSWIPPRWTSQTTRSTMCPECEHIFEIPYKFSLLGFIIDGINTLISPRIPYQQFILLKRRNAV